MREAIFPYLVKNFVLEAIDGDVFTSIMVFLPQHLGATTVDLEDGEYSIEVILEVEADGRLLHLRQL